MAIRPEVNENLNSGRTDKEKGRYVMAGAEAIPQRAIDQELAVPDGIQPQQKPY